MTRITALNGSPKARDSVSGMLIDQMARLTGAAIPSYQAVKPSMRVPALLDADALLIVFPLYVDSLPAPLIRALTLLEQAAKTENSRLPTVYAIVNCGFYEAEHNRLALDMVAHFCARAGFPWGYGIGIGGGGIVASQSAHMEKGVASGVYEALRGMADAITRGGERRENVFVTPKFPRFLYKFGGHMGWRQMAKRNGAGALYAQPHAVKKS